MSRRSLERSKPVAIFNRALGDFQSILPNADNIPTDTAERLYSLPDPEDDDEVSRRCFLERRRSFNGRSKRAKSGAVMRKSVQASRIVEGSAGLTLGIQFLRQRAEVVLALPPLFAAHGPVEKMHQRSKTSFVKIGSC